MLKQSETQFHSVHEGKKTANGKVLVSHKLLIFQVMSFCKLGRKMKNSVGKLRDFQVFDLCHDLLKLQQPLYDGGWENRNDQTIRRRHKEVSLILNLIFTPSGKFTVLVFIQVKYFFVMFTSWFLNNVAIKLFLFHVLYITLTFYTDACMLQKQANDSVSTVNINSKLALISFSGKKSYT